MKKIINNPDQFVDEMVEGILLAHPDQVRTPGDDRRVLVRADSPAPGRVGIVTGGGSGHLPLFKGYVGKGLCSGVAIGNVFSSPSVQQCADAAKAVDGGAGVLFLYGNYGGDVFNFDLAVDLLELDGIETRTVLGCDDVASQPKERAKDRRGVAGIFFAYKAAGAAAERGDSLEEVTRIATKVNDQTRSMGLALGPCTVPHAGKPSFELGEDEIELGIGIHGEPGYRRGSMESADALIAELYERVREDLGLAEGERVVALVNGMGGTPVSELYICFRALAALLKKDGIEIARQMVGNYVTSLEMPGVSVTLMRADEELLELFDAPVNTVAWK